MIKKLFLDTNVVLDLLGEREPYYIAAARIATLADKGRIALVVSSLTYATVYYILSKYESSEIVKDKVRKFNAIAMTADLTGTIIDKGLSSGFTDFEDALQYHCSLQSECDVIITRNVKDFNKADLIVLTPNEYLNSLETQ